MFVRFLRNFFTTANGQNNLVSISDIFHSQNALVFLDFFGLCGRTNNMSFEIF